MKKFFSLFLILALCLCGCSIIKGSPEEADLEEVTFPPIPTYTIAQDLPTTPQDSTAPDEEDTQAVAPTEKPYPWEVEFDDTKYTLHKEEFTKGTDYLWLDGSKVVREATYYNDGSIVDNYFYPSELLSHSCFWNTDGSYWLIGFLDNGYIETAEDGTQDIHLGTQILNKTINADGSYLESRYNAEGVLVVQITQSTGGRYQELRYNSKGSPSYDITRNPDGSWSESLYYDNGGSSKYTYHDPVTGSHHEESYYENGNRKSLIDRDPQYETEAKYDEDGFTTYFHTKQADFELELFADENGKLVKAIENGQAIEDPDSLLQLAKNHGFKN